MSSEKTGKGGPGEGSRYNYYQSGQGGAPMSTPPKPLKPPAGSSRNSVVNGLLGLKLDQEKTMTVKTKEDKYLNRPLYVEDVLEILDEAASNGSVRDSKIEQEKEECMTYLGNSGLLNSLGITWSMHLTKNKKVAEPKEVEILEIVENTTGSVITIPKNENEARYGEIIDRDQNLSKNLRSKYHLVE